MEDIASIASDTIAGKAGYVYYRDLAVTYLNEALSTQTLCIHNPSTFNGQTLCNGTVDELENADGTPGPAHTLSVNTGQTQSPMYGFGQMTAVASAVLGIRSAGRTWAFGTTQKKLARALFREMQDHVSASTSPVIFKKDCIKVTGSAGAWSAYNSTGDCSAGETNNYPGDYYYPEMVRLDRFYSAYSIGTPRQGQGLYESNRFYSGFKLGPSVDTDPFTYGRYEYWFKYGYDWVRSTPSYMPHDTHDPIGFLEQVSSTGLAQGWTCDPDSEGANEVNFYIGNVLVQKARANSASEDAINIECRSGTAHRFWVQLTNRGPIRAYGLDYTWYGYTELPCLGTCSW